MNPFKVGDILILKTKEFECYFFEEGVVTSVSGGYVRFNNKKSGYYYDNYELVGTKEYTLEELL